MIWIALVLALAAALGALVALRMQLHPSRRPAPAAAAAVATRPAARAPSASLPVDDGGEEAWAYEGLNADERAVVDRGRDVAGWEGVHRAFSESAPATSADHGELE